MVVNNVTKFHKILIKTIRLRERTSFKMVNFHKQKAITAESMMGYEPLSNLKKTHGTRGSQSGESFSSILNLAKNLRNHQ